MNRRVTTACFRGFRLAAATAAFLAHTTPTFAQNLYVSGKVGISTSTPNLPLNVATCLNPAGDCVAGDASLSGGGYAMFGNQGSFNLVVDENEIMARNNNQGAELYINKDAGNLFLTQATGTFTQIGSGNGSSTAKAPLVIRGGSDIDLGDPLGEGMVQIGNSSAVHLVIDNNEILTRNGQSTGEVLHLNNYTGGMVKVAGIAVSSDIVLKQDIEPIRNALEKLGVLRGVTWRWKNGNPERPNSMGVIAQEVERVFPDIVLTDARDGLKSVQYNALIGVLIAGVNELAAESEVLHAERAVLDQRVTELETTVDTRVHDLASENAELRAQLRALTERMDALETGGGSCGR